MPTPPRASNRGPAAAPENRPRHPGRRPPGVRRPRLPRPAERHRAERRRRPGRPLPALPDPARPGVRGVRGALRRARGASPRSPTPTRSCRLWSRLVELTVEESAFVEMFLDARRTLPETDIGERLPAFVAATLPRAQAAGLVSRPADRRRTSCSRSAWSTAWWRRPWGPRRRRSRWTRRSSCCDPCCCPDRHSHVPGDGPTVECTVASPGGTMTTESSPSATPDPLAGGPATRPIPPPLPHPARESCPGSTALPSRRRRPRRSGG